MKCGWIENLIPQYCEDILDEYQLNLVTQHLENCEDCGLELDAVDRLLSLVENVEIEYPSPAEWNNFWVDLRCKIARTQVDQRSSLLNLNWYHGVMWKFAGIGCVMLLTVLLCSQFFGGFSLMPSYWATEDFQAVNRFFDEMSVVQFLEQINSEEQGIGFVWESDLVLNLESEELYNFSPETIAESIYLSDLSDLDFPTYPSGGPDNAVLTSMK